MKKFILTAAVIMGLVGISYGVASALNANGVTAHASCDTANCE